MAKVLILEDTPEVVLTMKEILEDNGHTVEAETRPDQVMDTIRRFEPDMVTLDISFSEMRDETGIAVLREIREAYPQNKLPVLVISGTANADKITQMMAMEISGYLGKPIKHDSFLKKVTEALEAKGLAHSVVKPWEARMVGESPAVLELILEIGKAAQAESDLLITGEQGVGKEQVAQKYRELSPRRNKPFVVVDCTNIPPNTFESEIFGHEKGAFTGAAERKLGKIEAANGGIVFFDEIGDLPENQQSKLLRLFQTKTFTRMSSHESIKLNVVVLAATNKNLHAMMQSGNLRKDFYYRLQYMKIEMPPLRDHLEDIRELVDHFIWKANWTFHKSVAGVEPEVLSRFQAMPWDGNVRQLEKCIESGVVKCSGRRLSWSDVESCFQEESRNLLPGNSAKDELPGDYATFKREFERERDAKERRFYLHHLERHQFNIQKTAQALGMARTYLNVVMRRLKIKKPSKA